MHSCKAFLIGEIILVRHSLSRTWLRSFSCFVVQLSGGLLYGYNIGNGASILKPLRASFPHVGSFVSLIPSVLLLGAALGSIINGPMIKWLGYKKSLFLLGLFTSICAFVSAVSPWFELLVVVRFCMGLMGLN